MTGITDVRIDDPESEEFHGFDCNIGWVQDDGVVVVYEANTGYGEGEYYVKSFDSLVFVGKPAKTIQRCWRRFTASKSATAIQRVWRGHNARWKCPVFSFKDTDGEVRPAKKRRTE